MRKISSWLVALLTSAASLVAICLFGFILSKISYFLGKVPFLSEAIGFIGELLDLGLTALAAWFIAAFIWKAGYNVIKKINGQAIPFDKTPVFYINNLFSLVFLGLAIFLGCEFFTLVGDVVASYTVEYQGIGKAYMFFQAVKDTYAYICSEHVHLYMICTSSLILFIINIFSDKVID